MQILRFVCFVSKLFSTKPWKKPFYFSQVSSNSKSDSKDSSGFSLHENLIFIPSSLQKREKIPNYNDWSSILYWYIQILDDPLVKADPKMLPKVQTEKYGGDGQWKDLKIKERQFSFPNKMLTKRDRVWCT